MIESVVNTSGVALDLTGGRMLSPGERADVELSPQHEQELVGRGDLTVQERPAPVEDEPSPEPVVVGEPGPELVDLSEDASVVPLVPAPEPEPQPEAPRRRSRKSDVTEA